MGLLRFFMSCAVRLFLALGLRLRSPAFELGSGDRPAALADLVAGNLAAHEKLPHTAGCDAKILRRFGDREEVEVSARHCHARIVAESLHHWQVRRPGGVLSSPAGELFGLAARTTSRPIHPTGLEPVTFGSVDRCATEWLY